MQNNDALVKKVTPQIVREVIETHKRLDRQEGIRVLSELDHILAGMPEQAAAAEMIFGCSPESSRVIHVDLIYLGMKIAERALTGHAQTTNAVSFGFGRAA